MGNAQLLCTLRPKTSYPSSEDTLALSTTRPPGGIIVRIIQSRAVVRIGFAALIVIWISTFVVEQVTFYELNKAQTRVRQLEQARTTVNALVSVFLNAETGQRGFLLTGDEKYLRPYNSARAQLDS
ncbi:MAG: CHASE3 domain-containing protein, partial [Verrucomicrobia bacterium]|nr:CHASE3 domain-containing protein [Verrucomicrobiota bacterium]